MSVQNVTSTGGLDIMVKDSLHPSTLIVERLSLRSGRNVGEVANFTKLSSSCGSLELRPPSMELGLILKHREQGHVRFHSEHLGRGCRIGCG